MAKIIFEKNVEIPMRDGCVLRGDLFRPDTPEKLPVIINRTPYNKAMPMVFALTMDSLRAAAAGYNVLIQDCRGRFASDGEWDCFTVEARDGYDTVEWAARQPWSDGNIGMYGASYMGATQWLAASTAPPHLKCISPLITASDYHDGWTYQGGAFSLFFNVSWTMGALAPARLLREREQKGANETLLQELGATVGSIDRMRDTMEHLPLRDFPMFRKGAPYFFDWLAHPGYDDYWKSLNIEEQHRNITVPALNIGGWYDIFQGGTIRNYLGMRKSGANDTARRAQRLVLGPWHHAVPLANLVGSVDFGMASSPISIDLDGTQLRWFDHWLKGARNGFDAEAPVRVFTMGINKWRDEKEWPLPGSDFRRFYLHSRGRANSSAGDGALSTENPGDEPSDVFLYNPLHPAPTIGGALCCYPGALQGGAWDQREAEERADVLVYSTEPLAEDFEVTGPVRMVLYASSSAPDTDFTAKLVDVNECGFARNLTEGIIRARYRESFAHEKMLKPGEVTEFSIDMWSTSNVFQKGHRIRLEISSSNFPRFDRNPNTGHPQFADAETRPAIQTVMHNRGFASHLVLPVIPANR
ncbi:MAG TPA: CocE/NonD family hydrolase [Candidatus Binataceae bacterium]|nr:CocE/NonD family hydrolase [Candidatus Binataceae bacterium]